MLVLFTGSGVFQAVSVTVGETTSVTVLNSPVKVNLKAGRLSRVKSIETLPRAPVSLC